MKTNSMKPTRKAINTHVSTILIVTGPIQRYRLAKCIKKQDPYPVVYKKHISPSSINTALAKQIGTENKQASLFNYLTK